MRDLQLSIIIVNWNTKDYLKDCLSSIFKSITELNFEVIVVDNNSADESVEMVKRNFHRSG